ncbi:MAG: phenylacetyl CoA [Magnetospirillum sp.]|nr:phenylacetyl CoA [Magnetospirillum sp.]
MTTTGQFNGIAPAPQAAWDMRAAGNFVGGGSGTGLLIFAAAAAYLGQPDRGLLFAGLVLVGLGLFSVFLEIGRPFRAANVMIGIRYSWMTREAWVAGVLFPLGAAALLWPGVLPLVGIPAVLYLYCQARILHATKGIPAWRQPLMVPLIISTALAEGSGALVMAGAFTVVPAWAPAALMAAVAARLLVWMAYRRKLADGGAPLRAAAAAVRFSMPFTLGGNLAPVLMLVVAGAEPTLADAALPAAGLTAMLGGWALKAAIVTSFAHTQGFAIPFTPARGAGRPGPGAFPGWR